MSQNTTAQKRIDQFLNGPGGRADDWRDLVEGANVGFERGSCELDAALADLSVTEEFHGYPAWFWWRHGGSGRGRRRRNVALACHAVTQAPDDGSFRQHAGDWSLKDTANGRLRTWSDDIWAASGGAVPISKP